MAHQSLYRTYRPETFDDVIGQSEIVAALRAQAEAGTPAHAYLFAGSRGLGKTSIARIFARALGTSSKDLYEIDAASNNSVEDIRTLTENVHTLPFESPYKIYLLDEAHMLSKSAWNAFLKTLEEPPAHAIFILATTERERVPETVESRCQTFTFRKPRLPDLIALIERVATREGFTIPSDAAELIAALADGSYRDALSVLGRVTATAPAGSGKVIDRARVEQATGAPRRALVDAFLAGMVAKDASKALSAIAQASEAGYDIEVFSTIALQQVREMLYARYAPDLLAPDADRPSSDLVLGVDAALLATLLHAHERLAFAPLPEIALELAVYERCAA